jgi:hypothetical protein
LTTVFAYFISSAFHSAVASYNDNYTTIMVNLKFFGWTMLKINCSLYESILVNCVEKEVWYELIVVAPWANLDSIISSINEA